MKIKNDPNSWKPQLAASVLLACLVSGSLPVDTGFELIAALFFGNLVGFSRSISVSFSYLHEEKKTLFLSYLTLIGNPTAMSNAHEKLWDIQSGASGIPLKMYSTMDCGMRYLDLDLLSVS